MARPPLPNNVGIENLPARMVEHLEAWRALWDRILTAGPLAGQHGSG